MVKKQFSRYDVSKEKPDDNLHPMSRFIFVTVKYDPKLGGDVGKYYVCSYSSLIHYFIFSSNTMLFEENVLSDLVNRDGEPLYVGQLHIKKCKKKFTDFVKPRDLKASLCLLSYLFLENHSVLEEKSFLFDSAMLSIMASSEGEALHMNSIGKPNKMFARFVIDFLAMSLLFDCSHVHNSLVAPVPYSKKQH